MNKDDEFALRELKARADIHQVLARLARALDRCDRALALSAYHEDGWDAHGSFNGPAAEFVDWAIDTQSSHFIWTSHYLTNIYIELDGDKAAVETYVQVIMRFERDGRLYDLAGCGRYLDRFECREGLWKIAHRQVIGDWNRVDPIVEQMDDGLIKQLVQGTRTPADPSYAYFPAKSDVLAPASA
ncbi:nuclear transport factor 2 family protein [Sphingobium sp. AP50]|uniref:nuclear transport factor 2 family protein n=1 Tax=Sphingobium sp. AP50 TaxID=1884369 RepID=UPI0015A70689|nr:nuclear transport factor 2 family protein [Sphingobium sp. AP50]